MENYEWRATYLIFLLIKIEVKTNLKILLINLKNCTLSWLNLFNALKPQHTFSQVLYLSFK